MFLNPQVSDRLAPFLKLYEVGVEWSDRLEEWLHSPVGTHDPDVISQEVAATWRTVYKLEKGFSDIPAAKNVVLAVNILHFVYEFCMSSKSHLISVNFMRGQLKA